MEEAKADLRSQLPEIARNLPKVKAAAEKINADPEKRKVIKWISAIVKEGSASPLSPVALLIVLWWALAIVSAQDLAVLAVWYAIARDVYKKD